MSISKCHLEERGHLTLIWWPPESLTVSRQGPRATGSMTTPSLTDVTVRNDNAPTTFYTDFTLLKLLTAPSQTLRVLLLTILTLNFWITSISSPMERPMSMNKHICQLSNSILGTNARSLGKTSKKQMEHSRAFSQSSVKVINPGRTLIFHVNVRTNYYWEGLKFIYIF